MDSDRRPLAFALLISLLIHAPLLSLTFGGHGLGIASFGSPWPDLHVVIVPTRVATANSAVPAVPAVPAVAGRSQQASIEQPVTGGPALAPPASAAPLLRQAPDTMVSDAAPTAMVMPEPNVAAGAADGADDARLARIDEPAPIALERSDAPTEVAPAAPSVPTPVVWAAASASSPEQEARRQVELLEAARLETEREKVAQQAAARQEAARQEAARQEAARQEAARQEVERVELTRLEAERQEVARQTAARQEAARVQAAQEEAQAQTARREAARRAMGRQLDEEAARREAASAATRLPATLPYSWSSARRGRLLGRTDPNAELVLYAEAWARKIQFNMTFDMVREAAKRPHVSPLVTVAIRHDGSVESVTFVVPSGVAEIDEAVRRIVQSQAPYQAFASELAREFDVIEIRRTWYFDTAVRLY